MNMKMNYLKSIDLRLLPMKAIMFGWFGANACASPFFSIHMKGLGLTAEDAAIVYIMLPITQFLTSPIAGFIVDRLGKFRNILLLSLIMVFTTVTALMFIPPINSLSQVKSIVFAITCNNQHITNVQCEPLSGDFMIDSCSVNCTDLSVTNSILNITSELVTSDFCNSNSSLIDSSYRVAKSVCSSIPFETTFTCNVKCTDALPSLSPEAARKNWLLTFWLYSAVLIVYNIFCAIGYTIVNAATIILTETKDTDGEYGRVRLWAMVATTIFPPLAGLLVEAMSTDAYIDYSSAFYFHNAITFFNCFAVWHLDIKFERPSSGYKETFQHIKQILRSPPIFVLLLVTFWIGTMWGFFESFLFWFLIELKSPTYMLGLTITVGSFAGLPFLYYAKYIVLKIGHSNVLSLAVFMYMVRSVGHSFLVDPWWVMPYEVLEIFTFHLMWVAAATHGADLSPPGLIATVQGFIEGVHYGAGLGAGSLLGGLMIQYWGLRKAFQVMGIVSGGVTLLNIVLNFTWLRRYNLPKPQPEISEKQNHEIYNTFTEKET